MKYCLLSISCSLAMLLCANKVTAQEKIDPKTQTTSTEPEPCKLFARAKPLYNDGTNLLGKFDKTPLIEVLKQVSKWFNVEVNYNNIPDVKVMAALNKNIVLSELLHSLNIMYHTKLVLKDCIISNLK